MKILVIGDPHFKVSTIRESRNFSNKIKIILTEHKPDKVVILGDLHDSFERLHSLVSKEICYLFEIITRVCRLVYLVGNHCRINNSGFLTDEHAFLPHKKWQNLIIIDTPYTDEHGFTYVPYVSPGRFHEALSVAENEGNDWKKSKALFAHQEFRGVQMGPIASKVGDLWDASNPLVVSGHIHEYQWLQKNILYVGSPYQTTFSEKDDKTVSLLEFSDGAAPIHTRIDLGMPKRVTLTMTVERAKDVEGWMKFPQNAMIRVYLTGTTEELTAFKKTIEYKTLAKLVKLIPKPSDPVSVRRNATGRGFMDLLKESVATESEAVQEAFKEVQSALKA